MSSGARSFNEPAPCWPCNFFVRVQAIFALLFFKQVLSEFCAAHIVRCVHVVVFTAASGAVVESILRVENFRPTTCVVGAWRGRIGVSGATELRVSRLPFSSGRWCVEWYMQDVGI